MSHNIPYTVPDKTKQEYLMCSAIYVNDETRHEAQPLNISIGFVISGRRHHNCFATLQLIYPQRETLVSKIKNHVQGFLTSHDRFVDRKEALEIARSANQLIGDKTIARTLTSEDLW